MYQSFATLLVMADAKARLIAVGENAEIQARFAIAKAMLYRYLSLGGSFNVVEGQNKLAIDAAQFAKENALDEKTRNFAISLLDEWGEN